MKKKSMLILIVLFLVANVVMAYILVMVREGKSLTIRSRHRASAEMELYLYIHEGARTLGGFGFLFKIDPNDPNSMPCLEKPVFTAPGYLVKTTVDIRPYDESGYDDLTLMHRDISYYDSDAGLPLEVKGSSRHYYGEPPLEALAADVPVFKLVLRETAGREYRDMGKIFFPLDLNDQSVAGASKIKYFIPGCIAEIGITIEQDPNETEIASFLDLGEYRRRKQTSRD